MEEKTDITIDTDNLNNLNSQSQPSDQKGEILDSQNQDFQEQQQQSENQKEEEEEEEEEEQIEDIPINDNDDQQQQQQTQQEQENQNETENISYSQELQKQQQYQEKKQLQENQQKEELEEEEEQEHKRLMKLKKYQFSQEQGERKKQTFRLNKAFGQFPCLFSAMNLMVNQKLKNQKNQDSQQQGVSLDIYGEIDECWQKQRQFEQAVENADKKNEIKMIKIVLNQKEKESFYSLTKTTYYIIQSSIVRSEIFDNKSLLHDLSDEQLQQQYELQMQNQQQQSGKIQSVKRRYNNFQALDNYFQGKIKLFRMQGIILPGLPKKDLNLEEISSSVMGLFSSNNQEEQQQKKPVYKGSAMGNNNNSSDTSDFIKNRQDDLEQYLQYIRQIDFFSTDTVFRDFIGRQDCIIPEPNLASILQEENEENQLLEKYEQQNQQQQIQNQNQEGYSVGSIFKSLKDTIQNVTEKTKVSIGTYYGTQQESEKGQQIASILKEIKNNMVKINIQIPEELSQNQNTKIRAIGYMVEQVSKIQREFVDNARYNLYYWKNLLLEKESGSFNSVQEKVAIENKIKKSEKILDQNETEFIIYLKAFQEDMEQNLQILFQLMANKIK